MAIEGDHAASEPMQSSSATKRPLTRRQMLRFAAWGGAGALLPACGIGPSGATPANTAAPTSAEATSVPPTPITVEQLKNISPDAYAAMPLYHKAYDHMIATTYWNTIYWDNGPDQRNLYTVPFSWWGQFLFVTLRVKPSGV